MQWFNLSSTPPLQRYITVRCILWTPHEASPKPSNHVCPVCALQSVSQIQRTFHSQACANMDVPNPSTLELGSHRTFPPSIKPQSTSITLKLTTSQSTDGSAGPFVHACFSHFTRVQKGRQMSRAFSTGRFLKALPKHEKRAHPDRNTVTNS